MFNLFKWMFTTAIAAVFSFVILAIGYSLACTSPTTAPYAAALRDGVHRTVTRIQSVFAAATPAAVTPTTTAPVAPRPTPPTATTPVSAGELPADKVYAEIVFSLKRTP